MPSRDDTQSPCGLFIQMSGAPGSGKSTMARLLRRSIGGLVIDHDVLRSALLQDNNGNKNRNDDDDENNVVPFDRAAKHAYNLQWALAQDAMEQGLNVIVDSTCNFPEVVERGSALAGQHGFEYWYVECRVTDVDLLDERLRARVPMRSQRGGVDRPPAAAAGAPAGEDSRALFERWIERPCRPERNVIIVDSTGGPEELRDHILSRFAG